jgi:hypothetical protein
VLSSRKEYLLSIKNRYVRSSKKGKKLILDEFCAVCGYNRKYACRLLSQKKSKIKRKAGRKAHYLEDLLKPLKELWFATDQMCSKKFAAAIPSWLPFYEAEIGGLSPHIRQQLLQISPATIDRLLKPVRIKYKLKGLSGTKPGSLLKNQIPIRTDFWDISRPGFLEADTVAHCGNSLSGEFIWSLTLTDYHSTWTENRAVWTKNAHGVISGIRDIENNLPFKILGFDSDNGSEFLNQHLWDYFADRKEDAVAFTRTRPYKKNDNAHVEQKNWTHVRQLFGYDRYDKLELVDLMNDLYKNAWGPYQNFFSPTMKLISKTRVNSKYVKKYDSPKTPYQRLLNSKDISDEKKQKLTQIYNSLNPFQLKKSIEQKLKIISTVLRTTKIS